MILLSLPSSMLAWQLLYWFIPPSPLSLHSSFRYGFLYFFEVLFTLQIKIKSKQNRIAILQAVLCDSWLIWSPSAPEYLVVLLAFRSMSLHQASAQGCRTTAQGPHVQANQYFYYPPPKAKISQSTFFLYLLSHSNYLDAVGTSWNNSKR